MNLDLTDDLKYLNPWLLVSVKFTVDRERGTYTKFGTIAFGYALSLSRLKTRMGRNITLTIVRHGETEANLSHLVQGHIDMDLTNIGESQAELLGKHMAYEKFTRAYASDLCRAHRTAELILKHSKHPRPVPVIQDARLREKYFGEMEGKPYSVFQSEIAKHGNEIHWLLYTPNGGENHEEVRERVKDFFMELVKLADFEEPENPSTEHILIVTHGGALFVLLKWLREDTDTFVIQGFDPSEPLEVFGNTAVTQITIDPCFLSKDDGDTQEQVPTTTLTFTKINDTSHLTPA